MGADSVGEIEVSGAYTNLCTRDNAPYSCVAACDFGYCSIVLTSNSAGYPDCKVERYPNQTMWNRSCTAYNSMEEAFCASLQRQGWD